MKNIFKLMLALVTALIVVSCSDESKNPLPDFTTSQGSFVRFVLNGVPPATVSYAEPANAIFSGIIEDVNENTTSYTLDLTATVSDETLFANDLIQISQFPANLEISAQQIADGLGLTLDDLNFGDNFAFVATAVRNDGVEFTGEQPSYDAETGILSGGNTSNNLLGLPGYRSAMGFNFTYACPAFEIETLAGTYDVTANLLAGGLGLTDPNPVREVVVGPGDNQITVIGGSVGFAGGDDLVVNIDVESGSTALGLNEQGSPGLAFPDSIVGFPSDYNTFQPGGLALSCLDPITIDLPFTLTCCGGTWTLSLRKQ